MMISCLLLAALSPASPTTIYLVRHAEKIIEPKVDDPDLTEAGKQRAEALAKILKDAKVNAVHATEYQRTQKTVAPLAKALGIEVEKLSSKDPAAYAKHILEKHAGQTVVIAGHSNTLPEMIKTFGVKEPVVIGDPDYGGLYVVIRDGPGGDALLLRLHYGQ